MSTFRAYVQGEDTQRPVDFYRQGATGHATAMKSPVRTLPGDEILVFADASKQRLTVNLAAWPVEVPETFGAMVLVLMMGGAIGWLLHRLLLSEARANESLGRSEAYLTEAQRLSLTGSFGWNVSSGEIYWSQETFRIFEYDPATKLTLELVLQRTHPEDRALARQVIDRASQERKELDFERRLLMPDGSVKHVRVVGHPSTNESGNVEFVGAVTDITERKRAEQRLRTQYTVTQLLAEATTIEEVTPKILQTVCEFLLWDLGALWSLDRQASVLRCVEVWHKESVKVPQFEAVTRERTLRTGVGLPGRVWSRHEPAYIPDVTKDANFPRGPIAAREGLHAAFAFPILLGGDVLGVMEFFSREIRQPEQELLNMMATLGSQIGQFIERKRAEDVNARLAAIVESSDDAIISKDLQGTIMSWNNGAARMFGYTAAEAVGQSIAMLIPTRFVDEEPRILERIRRGETLEHYETVRRHKDGREINISLTVSPLRDDAGNVVGASKIARDITERKRVEQRLLTQHTVTRILAEAASLQEAAPRILRAICASLIWNVAALWTVDKEAGVLRCVEVWHDESVQVPQFEANCRQVTFMPGVGLPGRVWSSQEPAYIPDVVHDTNFPRASIAAREGLHAAFGFPILLGADVLGVIEFFSHEIRQPDQELLDMMATLGSQIGQFIERKRAEEAFRTAQMELAHVTRVATLGEMTASIAHEINQPLGALVNNAGACLGWLDAENLEEARNSVALMMDDAQRASEIITRIRALVKKAPPQKDWLDINQIIREVIALAQSELQRNRITLETQLSDNVPPILADRIQLQQVMLNLMMNAIEAMTQVTTPRELLISSEADDSKGVVVVVRDSGAGLDSKSLERLFEPFYTTKPQGMGMGLAICRSIIQAHGGRLWATANEGRGAAFQFTLQACSKRE